VNGATIAAYSPTAPIPRVRTHEESAPIFDRPALNELIDYTDFTWRTYRNAVRALPADALARPIPGSGWPALRNVLFHIAGGWDSWLRDRLGLEDALDVASESIRTWDQLEAHRTKVRGWLRRVIDETSDDDLAAPTDLFAAGTPAETRVSPGQILAHIILHERGHHGDVTTLLAALGATPPAVDYLTYVFFKQRKAPA
jgi:uncharacterized damage-inducible protein DinB